jgi:hypothetical protein
VKETRVEVTKQKRKQTKEARKTSKERKAAGCKEVPYRQ